MNRKKFFTLRQALAAEALSYAMEPCEPGTRMAGGLNAALHAYLLCGRYDHGLLVNANDAAGQFDQLQRECREAARGIAATWDGWEFSGLHTATHRFVRATEAIYSHFIPEEV